MKFLLFLSLVFIFILGIGYGNNDLVDYDYFHLVLQWPKSYCNTGKVTCYDILPNRFIFQVMLPQKNGHTVSCPKISNEARQFQLKEVTYIFAIPYYIRKFYCNRKSMVEIKSYESLFQFQPLNKFFLDRKSVV